MQTNHAAVDFLIELQDVAPGAPFLAGVRIRLDPGWHTYWLNPGEAGMAPRVVWDLPTGFSVGPLQWPPPKRFVSDGVVGFGYENEVVLLAEITPPREPAANARINLGASVDFLVCGDVCLPAAAQFSRALSWGLTPMLNENEATVLREARRRIPSPLSESECDARLVDRAILLRITGTEWAGVEPEFLAEARDLLALDARSTWTHKDGGIEGLLPLSHLARGIPLRLRGVLVWEHDGVRHARRVDVKVKR